jgi:predicted anti-sigma-YlaC factor YlaD
MKCEEIKEMMLDAAAGEATPAMNEHLRGCTDCMEKFAGMQQTMALLDEWQVPEPSPYFDTRFAARMREERAKPQRAAWLSWFRAPALAGALALALMMAGGVNWFTSRSGGEHVAKKDGPSPAIVAPPERLWAICRNSRKTKICTRTTTSWTICRRPDRI